MEKAMSSGARAFLEEIIDYAGLFPPTQLPFEQAMANYLRYRRGPDSWVLGRFICPASRLKELSAFRDEVAQVGKLRLAVLGRGGKDSADFLANLVLDLADISALTESWGIYLAAA